MTNTLQNGTTLTGCISTAKVLTIDSTSTWNATSNSVVTSLTNSGTINLIGKITTTNVLVKSGGTFGGSGTLSSNLTVNSGATLILNPDHKLRGRRQRHLRRRGDSCALHHSISAGTYKLLTYSNSLSGTPTFTYSAPERQRPDGGVQHRYCRGDHGHHLCAAIGPDGLTATAGGCQVMLAWNAATNATGYNVKRSLTSGGSYTLIATNLASLAYTNTGLANGTLYYFVVSATNSAGESANFSQVSARPVAATRSRDDAGPQQRATDAGLAGGSHGLAAAGADQRASTGLGTNWVTVSGSDTQQPGHDSPRTANGSVFFRLVHP